ncbi:hypothetical protein C8D92_101365 [Tamilnaduibacter salinus]|uniref:Uncharacterized protein n=1 Tax=Tamilnaduibacter salinus TaxID=1484056 RepID=A0A2U1D1H2_9GAMM|nr:hypothetical protein C8D92_101365 [Tamilnaduibacter salinus]
MEIVPGESVPLRIHFDGHLSRIVVLCSDNERSKGHRSGAVALAGDSEVGDIGYIGVAITDSCEGLAGFAGQPMFACQPSAFSALS